jgi:hypothetical protein
MSGDVWVFGLNASLAWWVLRRIRDANRVDPPSEPTGSPAWWGAQAPTAEEPRQE